VDALETYIKDLDEGRTPNPNSDRQELTSKLRGDKNVFDKFNYPEPEGEESSESEDERPSKSHSQKTQPQQQQPSKVVASPPSFDLLGPDVSA
jgi:hypothetical protein